MYQGGKNGAGTYQKIINWIPPHKIYIEPFLGSGAIMRYKKLAPVQNIGIDIDPGVIAKFNYPAGTNIFCNDALKLLKTSRFSKDTFIYADPPYPKGSRLSSKDIYNYEISDKQHVQLLKILLSVPAMVAISTYKNSIYEKMLSKWNCITFPSQTRQGTATEYLYMNYSAPNELHDYSFLGNNFIDRQRIKRKIDRHVNRLLHLPELERQAIIQSIQDRID